MRLQWLAFILSTLFITMAQALPIDLGVTISNNIVPLNSTYANELSATIGLSSDPATIPNGSAKVVAITSSAQGAIIISAPFCGKYLGYACFVPLPEQCFLRLGKSGKLVVSGVMTEFGLDKRSLQCFFIAEDIPEPLITQKKHCLFHCND